MKTQIRNFGSMLRWCFIFFVCSSVYAQTTNTAYHILFLSERDSVPLYNVDVRIDRGEQLGFSNINGIVTFDQSSLKNEDSVFITAEYENHNTLEFYSTQLKPGDTIVLYMIRAPYRLDAIELTRYEVPLIEPTLSGKRRGRKSESAPIVKPDTIPAYTPHEISLYDSLTKGLYVIPDSIRATGTNGRNFFDYLKNNIRIPESSVTHKEEGTVYMRFEIDSNGYVQNIQCVHGNCPALAIAAAEVLARTPCIPPSEWEAPGTKRKTERYLLPVKLVVQ